MKNIKGYLKQIPFLKSVILSGGKLYRVIRTRYLLSRYPQGHFLHCNGINVFCNFNDETYTWYDGPSPNLAFDQKIIQALLVESAGNVFIDIGAHFGFFAAYLSQISQTKSGEVKLLALEPDPEHFRCLQKTLSRLSRSDTVLLPMAMSDVTGPVTLYRTAASCLHSYAEEGATVVGQVPAISLDTLVAEYLQPDDQVAFIKIDVDGAEPLFLAGGIKTFKIHTPNILMEFAPGHISQFGLSPQQFYNQLCEQFEVYWVSYRRRRVKQVSPANYFEIKEEIGEGITDLVLSKFKLGIEGVKTDRD